MIALEAWRGALRVARNGSSSGFVPAEQEGDAIGLEELEHATRSSSSTPASPTLAGRANPLDRVRGGFAVH